MGGQLCSTRNQDRSGGQWWRGAADLGGSVNLGELEPDELVVHPGLRRAVVVVAGLNIGYFGIEFAVASAIGSVSLFADSVDFLEDAAVNLLVLLALGWPAPRRAMLGVGLGLLLLAPSAATLWTAWRKFGAPVPPLPVPMMLAGLGALVVNLSCAVMLARWRVTHGSLTRAAFLSARNDAIANVAIVGAGVVTVGHASAWPDLAVGLGIFGLNLNAAREIWEAAHKEFRGVGVRAG
jgi:Co/Zn/Cd efflux system component